MAAKKDISSVVLLGLSGFPVSSAAVNKCTFMLKAIIEYKNIQITIVNNKPAYPKDKGLNIHKYGFHEGIKFMYTSVSPFKPRNFILKRLAGFVGNILEIPVIIQLKWAGKLDIAMIYLPKDSFLQLLKYWMLSRLLSFPIAVNWVEYFGSFEGRQKKLWNKINDLLFSKYLLRFSDGVIPISSYLERKVAEKNPNKPVLKIPVLADSSIYNSLHDTPHSKCFVYCGSASYSDNLELIFQAFDKLNDLRYSLLLIVNGSEKELRTLNELIQNHKKKDLIFHYSNLQTEMLYSFYKKASALLIPLKNTTRDLARFPQKVAEYALSGNPIISTNFGEMKNYFTDMENALLANEYDVDQFSSKMQYVIDQPVQANEIGLKGQALGIMNFEYRNYGKPLYDFLSALP